eukprot:1178933-Prorocentrum_minimum.AAC.3
MRTTVACTDSQPRNAKAIQVVRMMTNVASRSKQLSHYTFVTHFTAPIAEGERDYTRIGHQLQKGRENIPVAGTNRRRGERIYPHRAPIAEGEREYTLIGHQSQKGRENIRYGFAALRCILRDRRPLVFCSSGRLDRRGEANTYLPVGSGVLRTRSGLGSGVLPPGRVWSVNCTLAVVGTGGPVKRSNITYLPVGVPPVDAADEVAYGRHYL